ncbi:MAG TPA: molybdopterin-dependent oxidoreductase, partial [Methylomirabilota bacterium]|nr:molybdopterin-dependent oxidoreductase [Methylomirabilota bacterium]
KAPCRFCGTGCGVQVGLAGGRVVAVRGDEEAAVNRGMLCVKGSALPAILYGADRLTRPLLRRGDRFVPVTWDEALDRAAARIKDAMAAHGPQSVAAYFSGQSTVFEGYAVNKLWKAGLGSNQVDGNPRLCMASAVSGFMSTFGMDEPMGCYDDLELADVVVAWGSNFAEMHPILFARVMERRHQDPRMRIVSLQTFLNRSTDEPADVVALFKPGTDLALANGIAHVLLKENLVDREFVTRHVTFKKGLENLHYGVKDTDEFGGQAPSWATWKPFADQAQAIGLDDYRRFLDAYAPERVAQVTGVPAETIVEIARLYGDPKRKVVSLWTMGFNQHVRGTWINNLVYNLHLLTGKISEPGNNPMSLTGQPSACGTTREAGVLSHTLPGGMLIANPEHRKRAAEIWKVPMDRISPKPGYHTVEMFRALDRGEIKVIWINSTNPFQTLPNAGRYRKGARKGADRFVIVSEVYPSETARHADLLLPSAMWVEKEGMFGNTERRSQHWKKMIDPPGEARDDLWQIVELARRLGHGGLFEYGDVPLPKALYEEYRQFGLGHGKDLAPYDTYVATRGGLRWPVVDGKETRWRYREGFDPYVKPGEGVRFYGNADGKAVIWARPYEPPAEVPDAQFPFWLATGRVLEHWHSGTLTRRVPQLHRAVPAAPAWLNPDDARAAGIGQGDRVRVASRRGEVLTTAAVGERNVPPRGVIFIPFFDEGVLVNLVTLDAYDPISKEPDFKKCAVRLEKA